MAEFRKREDITQEIDILQTWSEMGAPRMGDLEQNLQALVKSVDPGLMKPGETPPRRVVPPPVGRPAPEPKQEIKIETKPVEPELPPLYSDEPPPPSDTPPVSPFADLPPGDEDDHPRGLAPIFVTAVLVLAAIAAVVSRWEPFTVASRPTSAPTKAAPKATPTPMHVAVAPTVAPTHAPKAAPTHEATVAPTHAPTAAPMHPLPAPTLAGTKPTTVTAHVRKPPKAIVREYRVHVGDSLSAIARDQLGSIEKWHELYAANKAEVADPNLIEPGQVLKMPVPTVVVKPGDTLEAIAKANLGDANRWQEIYDLNKGVLKSPTVVPPGTTLKLPEDAEASMAPARTAASNAAAVTHHTVRHGDSLSLLAQRYLGSAKRWPEIYYLNSHQIANPHWVFPGQVLAIPAAHRTTKLRYVVRSGDCLWAIAGREMGSNYRWTQIYQANRDVIRNPHWIYPGQVFKLP